jgi:hypothetical protein
MKTDIKTTSPAFTPPNISLLSGEPLVLSQQTQSEQTSQDTGQSPEWVSPLRVLLDDPIVRAATILEQPTQYIAREILETLNSFDGFINYAKSTLWDSRVDVQILIHLSTGIASLITAFSKGMHEKHKTVLAVGEGAQIVFNCSDAPSVVVLGFALLEMIFGDPANKTVLLDGSVSSGYMHLKNGYGFALDINPETDQLMKTRLSEAVDIIMLAKRDALIAQTVLPPIFAQLRPCTTVSEMLTLVEEVSSGSRTLKETLEVAAYLPPGGLLTADSPKLEDILPNLPKHVLDAIQVAQQPRVLN